MPAVPKFFLATILVLGTAFFPPLAAQEDDPAPVFPNGSRPKESKTITTITSIRESIKSVTESLKTANEELIAATTAAEKEDIGKRIAELSETKARLNREVQEFITGIDLDKFNNPGGDELDLSLELRELLRPILIELKDATAKPRELENLRSLVASHEHRLTLAQKAVAQINKLISQTSDANLRTALASELKKWEDTEAQIEGDLSIAKIRLDEVENSSQSLFGSFTDSITNFARTRGRNLLFALIIGLSVFFILRLAHRLIHRLGPFKRRGKRSFGVRLVDVGYYVFNIFAAAMAALLTLYVLGDWIMLGLSILVIAGIVGKENLVNLSVEFKSAGASSLDYAILADFTGEVAASYERLHRAVQRICVNACNEHGWVIPFTQITLHNAAPVPTS